MVKIRINGKDYEVEPGNNLLHTCLALGFDIPYFCYHPALGSVGACRQCAVKKYRNADDKAGRIIMSCMEPVVDGMIISTDDPEVLDFRRAVIEALMTNHPHDCPVCDEGGECHLQDMTVMTGHNYRRFNFKKRTYRNQDLGPYISHEMNRCIQCYRCVRYYRDYAGGKDLHVFGSASHVYFGRHADGKLESIFSGNLVEVCPTGVFTDKTQARHFTRKWDLTNTPSVCNNCSVGCNIIVGERYGTIRRIRSRYNHEVNGYFICDRGRFGYGYIGSPERIRQVTIKNINPEASVNEVIKAAISDKRLVGIGSPTASLESNFALEKLVGKENFCHGIGKKEYEFVSKAVKLMRENAFHTPSLSDIENCDAVLVLGDDPVETAPMLGLAIRQCTRNKSFDTAAGASIPAWNDAAVRDISHNVYSPLFLATYGPSTLDDVVSGTFHGNAEEIEKFGSLIAESIMNKPASGKNDKSLSESAAKAAGFLSDAKNPLIVAGSKDSYPGILRVAQRIAGALTTSGKMVSFSVIVPNCNSVGLSLLSGKSFEELTVSHDDTLLILENDLYERADNVVVDAILEKAGRVIAIDHSANAITSKADIVLPSGTFAEATGTIINNEGRAQRYYRALPYNGEIKDGWRWIAGLMQLDNRNTIWHSFDDVAASFAEAYPFYAKIREMVPDAGLKYNGEKVPRQLARFSGRTAMNANVNVHEQKPPEDCDSPLSFSMEGYRKVPSSWFTTEYWSPGWNSPQAINKYLKEPGGDPVDGNMGVRIFDE